MNNTSFSSMGASEVKKAIESGCRMLAIREHSEKQIRLKLAQKGFDLQAIKSTVDYLMTENWLSETRFCNAYIRSKASKGQGLVRIRAELQHQEIQQVVIDQELKEEDIDWQGVCEDVLIKKLKSTLGSRFELKQIDEPFEINKKKVKQKLKLENFLRYRGFSGEEIKIAMKKHC